MSAAYPDSGTYSRTNGAPDPWADPEPLEQVALPAFPVDTLPGWLGEWAIAEAEFTQTPVDLAACLGLACMSLAVSRGFEVEVRPGWVEPCNLWVVVALPPGERKSAVFSEATRPIYDWCRTECRRMRPEIAKRQIAREVLGGQIERAKKAAMSGKPYQGGDAQEAAAELSAELANLPELRPPALMVDDCTPEALGVVLSEQGERLGLFSAEGGPFELMAGRYSERGSNFELYLKAHSGDPHVVHRIRRASLSLERPLLSMALTVQPEVVNGLGAKEGFRGKGLLARFLYAMPRSRVGFRLASPPPVPFGISGSYQEHLTCALAARGQRLSVDSLSDWHARTHEALEPRLAPDADLEWVRDWASKHVGAMVRVAGVLHVADACPCAPAAQISPSALDRARAIGDYFLAHACAAFGVMTDEPALRLARRLWGWVERQRRAEFSVREARRALCAKVDDMHPPLALMCERNLIRKRPAQPSKGGRPPGDHYDVHPTLYANLA